MLRYAAPLVKVTIVPRGKSLGAAWYLPEERQITNKEQLMDEITATLGGRAAEELIFGTVSTGALNDLERVTKQAYAMIAYYGLNKKIGNLSYYDSTGQQEYSFQRPYSEKTAQTIDDEAYSLIDEAYKKAKSILGEHKENLSKLANILLEKEVIFNDDLVKLFGKRPFEHVEHVLDTAPEEKTLSESDNKPPVKRGRPKKIQ
jgi:cell division protease FtsH